MLPSRPIVTSIRNIRLVPSVALRAGTPANSSAVAPAKAGE